MIFTIREIRFNLHNGKFALGFFYRLTKGGI
jgi:hypothetical protein